MLAEQFLTATAGARNSTALDEIARLTRALMARVISPMPFKLVGDGELIRGQGSLGWLPRIFLSPDMS
jgi:hypothetical protein